MNETANDLLERDLAEERGDARALVRSRARALGVLAPARRVSTKVDRSVVIAANVGVGPMLANLIDEGL